MGRAHLVALAALTLCACSSAPTAVALIDAPSARHRALTIDGGTIDTAAIGAYDRDCQGSQPVTARGGSPCVEHHFYVAPVRTATHPDGPVHAWMTCGSRTARTAAECAAVLSASPSSGRVLWRVGSPDSGWTTAIANSGLSTVDGAPVLLAE